jgi:alpha-galactosidase
MAAPAAMPEFKGNVAAVATAPFWAEELAAIDEKRAKVKQMAHLLKVKNKNTPNKDGTMNETQQKEYLKKYEAELITAEESSQWTRGASNAGYHYLGCAKTFALMGKAFAEANLSMMKSK